ncbi:MAG: ribonuclease PH [Planctomycetota bacterium]
MRSDGRMADQHRPVTVIRQYTRTAPGSVLIEMGGTRVLCTASVEAKVPPFLEGKGKGWLTAEYNMLPGSTSPRKPRDRSGKVDGRSVEIQRLIGRSLRNIVRLDRLGENTLWIDCDVIDADGGTRTASITGAFVALVDAIRNSPLAERATEILTDSVAAISVGVIDHEVRLDLDYGEDSVAGVDMNLVMTGAGKFIEVQGTGETVPFSGEQLEGMLRVGKAGISSLTEIQRVALGEAWPIFTTPT